MQMIGGLLINIVKLVEDSFASIFNNISGPKYDEIHIKELIS